MIPAASPFPHANRTPGFGDATVPSGHNGHLIPRIHGVCVHGDDRTYVRKHNRPRQVSLSQLNFLATGPPLRTPPCRIPPGRLPKTAKYLVRQSPLSPIPPYVPVYCFTLLYLAMASLIELQNLLAAPSSRTVRSSTLFRGEVSYLKAQGVRTRQRGMSFLFLCFISLTSTIVQYVGMFQAQQTKRPSTNETLRRCQR